MGKAELSGEYDCFGKGVQLVRQYRWKAVNSCGRVLSGSCRAACEEDAAAFVRANYGCLTFLKAEQKCLAVNVKQLFKSHGGLTDEEKAVFFGQLALMLGSGLPLLKALAVLEERLPRQAAQQCLLMQRDLQNGSSFAQSIKNRRGVWGELAEAVASAGEEGGILCEMLEELAQYYQLQAQMKRFIKNISMYPLFLLSASLATALMFIVKILPLFAELYASMDAQVPAYLTLLFALHGIFAEHWPLFLSLLFAAAALAAGRRQRLGQALLGLPFVKGYKQLYLEIRFNKVLALLLQGGVPLPSAAQTAGAALGDAGLRRLANAFAADILRGTSAGEAAAKAAPLFGSLSVEFISVGAETGRLPEMLNRAAQLLQYRFDDRLKKLKTVLEPLLLLLAAGFVSAIILAVAAPMFSLSGSLPDF